MMTPKRFGLEINKSMWSDRINDIIRALESIGGYDKYIPEMKKVVTHLKTDRLEYPGQVAWGNFSYPVTGEGKRYFMEYMDILTKLRDVILHPDEQRRKVRTFINRAGVSMTRNW